MIASLALVLAGAFLLISFAFFGVVSLREGERRAALIAFGIAAVVSIPFFAMVLLPLQLQQIALACIAVLVLAATAWLFFPSFREAGGDDEPQTRIDERDIMFARARLEPGSPDYETYYGMHPEKEAADNRTRDLPGLLSPQASAYHPLPFASTDASFGLTEALREAVDGPVSGDKIEYDAATMTSFVKDVTRYYGALTVGISQLMPYHVYTHVGRGDGPYGAPIELDHRFAIAFTVEMDREMVATAPYAATVMESAREYAESARVSIQLAGLLRSLGYPARAHIDGNYRVIAPLVARDAGLGEIGRMGLLMTPMLGPRVRLGIVTTDVPLLSDGRGQDRSVLDFCRVCEKCASCCPIHAIPKGDRQEIDGALRWRINDEMCFRYWNAVGTDCARCMSVCPYSHPDTLMHNLVRGLVRRSARARPAVARLDDLFYGVTPPPKSLPAWLPPKPTQED